MTSTTSRISPGLGSNLAKRDLPKAPSVSADPLQKRVQDTAQKPSSSTEGFFQNPPILLNQCIDDLAIQRAIGLFLPDSIRETCSNEIKTLGNKALSKAVFDLVADAEKNLPYVKHWDAWGRRQDELVTSEGWRKLSAIGVEEGMVAEGYDNEYLQFSRTNQFLKYLVWCGSAVWTTCTSNSTRNSLFDLIILETVSETHADPSTSDFRPVSRKKNHQLDQTPTCRYSNCGLTFALLRELGIK